MTWLIKHRNLERLVLVFGSLLFCLILLLFAEGLTRIFTDIRFLGNSKNLFVPNAFGESMGNAKEVEAISFGARVFTDGNGFRISETQHINSTSKESSLLILGDSVAFGPGVEEEKTFSGLLRINHPQLKVYNSSVIGYSTIDYKNLIENFQPATRGIDQVFLFFCLNDIDKVSSREIDRELSASDRQETENNRAKQAPESGSRVEDLEMFVSMLKQNAFVTKANDFLRTNSKLYLLIKGVLTDPQARYWFADYSLYTQENDDGFLSSMQNIIDINMLLNNEGVNFTVIILPYEYQLRSKDSSQLLPQQKLGEYFSRSGVHYYDSTSLFMQGGVNPKRYFLPYDPMHLSEKGHELVYTLLVERLGY